ncbi:MAG: hypothetical protein EBT13_13110 [Rhodobacteraceae bacterium]|nr:hypothetical protein [Paracoccaceae bacterium]
MSEKDPVDLVAESVKLQETALKLQIKNQPALRDLFAMAALQGLLANPESVPLTLSSSVPETPTENGSSHPLKFHAEFQK